MAKKKWWQKIHWGDGGTLAAKVGRKEAKRARKKAKKKWKKRYKKYFKKYNKKYNKKYRRRLKKQDRRIRELTEQFQQLQQGGGQGQGQGSPFQQQQNQAQQMMEMFRQQQEQRQAEWDKQAAAYQQQIQQFNANQAHQQAQLAFSQQRAARGPVSVVPQSTNYGNRWFQRPQASAPAPKVSLTKAQGGLGGISPTPSGGAGLMIDPNIPPPVSLRLD
mgnify:CR=1 FL=1